MIQLLLNVLSPAFVTRCYVWMCVCVCVCAQSCLTLCAPVDCSPPDSSVHGILQAGILEWVAMLEQNKHKSKEERTKWCE